MIGVYVACVIISIVICCWYFWVDVRRSVIQNIMLLILLIGNVGYLCLAVSKNLEEAILSNKLCYLSGCFLPVLYFLTVCEVCQMRVRKIWVAVMVCVQGAIYGLVCTVGYLNVYYTSVSFATNNGIGYLVKEYAPTHMLYIVSVLFYFAVAIVIAWYAIFRKKNTNRIELIVMVVCSGVAIYGYLVERIIDIDYEVMPVFFIILSLGALIPIYHSDIYTVTENQEVIDMQLNDVGFITFDRNTRFMGANETVTGLFEELKDVHIGTRIAKPSELLGSIIQEVGAFFEKLDKTEQEAKQLVVGDKTFELRNHKLKNFLGQYVGLTIEFRDVTEHAKIVELTRKYNEELSLEVEKKTERIKSMQERTILGMAQMVESRDLSTGGHIRRTSDVVRIFAKKLLSADAGMTRSFLELVIRSAPMHDLGKIGVDDAILRKQGRFTDEEYAQMKKHSEVGGKMVKEILTNVEEPDFVRVAFNVANYHHEKVNGKGYPEGLKGEEIPLEARIMALADVFDALVSKRCYKEAFSYDEAFAIIEKDAGEHFDAKLAAVFLTCRPELEAYYDEAMI